MCMEPDGKNRAGKQYRLVVKCIGFGINLSLGKKKKKKRTKKVLHFLCGIKTFSELCCFHKTFQMVLTQFV